jgi:hypothetical protein
MTREEAQNELNQLLYCQIQQLSMMSKIELGDDVIAEVQRLENIINPKNSINPVWEDKIRQVLDKIWENRSNLSLGSLEILHRLSNKKR